MDRISVRRLAEFRAAGHAVLSAASDGQQRPVNVFGDVAAYPTSLTYPPGLSPEENYPIAAADGYTPYLPGQLLRAALDPFPLDAGFGNRPLLGNAAGPHSRSCTEEEVDSEGSTTDSPNVAAVDTLSAASPELAFMPTVGSWNHYQGTCKPCAFAVKAGGICKNGKECLFCHLCEPGEKKRRKKDNKLVRAVHRVVARHDDQRSHHGPTLLTQGRLVALDRIGNRLIDELPVEDVQRARDAAFSKRGSACPLWLPGAGRRGPATSGRGPSQLGQ